MRLKVIRQLGEGSCANVYLVSVEGDPPEKNKPRDGELTGLAVLKQPKPGYERISGYEAVELRNIAKHGGHPNIVRVHVFLHSQPVEELLAQQRVIGNQQRRRPIPNAPTKPVSGRRPAKGLSLILEYCDGGSLNQFLEERVHSCSRFPLLVNSNVSSNQNAQQQRQENVGNTHTHNFPLDYGNHARHLFYPFVFCAGSSVQDAASSSAAASPSLSLSLSLSPCFSPVIPLPHVRRFIAELVDAVFFLRSLRQWHRDVKPANILLSSKDVSVASIKLADFGFARRTGKTEQQNPSRDSRGASKGGRLHSTTASRMNSSKEALQPPGVFSGPKASMAASRGTEQTVSLTSRSQWSVGTQSDGLFTSSGGMGTQGYMAPERLRCFLRDAGTLQHIERDLARLYGMDVFRDAGATMDAAFDATGQEPAAVTPFMYSRAQSEVWSLGMVLWEMIFGTILIGMLSSVRELVEAHRFVEEHVDHVVSCTLDVAGADYAQRGMEAEAADCRAAALLLRTMLRADPHRRVTLAALRKSKWLRGILRGEQGVLEQENENQEVMKVEDEERHDGSAPVELAPEPLCVSSTGPSSSHDAELAACSESAPAASDPQQEEKTHEENAKNANEAESSRGSFDSLSMSLSSWQIIDSPTSGREVEEENDEEDDLLYPIESLHEDFRKEEEAKEKLQAAQLPGAPTQAASYSWFSRLFTGWGVIAGTRTRLPFTADARRGGEGKQVDTRAGVISTQTSDGVIGTLISFLRSLWRRRESFPP